MKISFWLSNVFSRALKIGVLLCCFSVSISFSQQTVTIDSLKAVISKATDDSTSLKAYLLWGELIYEQYPDSAFFFWEKVRVLSKTKLTSKRPIYKKVYATACFNLGWYYYEKSNIKLAIEYYLISKNLFEELQDYLGQGSVLNSLGMVYQSYQKDYPLALKLYYQALYFLKRTDQPAYEVMAYNNIASVYRDMGDTTKSLRYYQLGCDISRANKDLNSEAKALFSIATFEYETGNKEKAKQSLERCIRISSEIDDYITLSGSLTSLGYVYLQEKNFEKAFELASKALAVAKKLGFPTVTKRAAKVLMKVHVQRRQWQKAFEMQELYFQMRDSIENVDKKSELTRQQLQSDYEKQTYADSLKHTIEQQQKDIIISNQQVKIDKARILRNSILFVSVLLLLLGWLFYNRYTLRLIQKQNELQINSLLTQQKLLRALMNPHFLFNSINSIQSLIVENETRLARDYLVKFSQLMRFILEHSRKSHISLQEEIDSLKLYIEMEQLRFNDSFYYEIVTSGLTINHETRIPPLLVQPFVENAIIHGLRHKKGKGKISIEFRLAEHSLECFIQDDGVGRMKAAQINENQRKSRRSMATELTENRLKSMSTKDGQIGSIRIDDLKDDHGLASGTRVELIIPYVTFE